MIRVIPKIPSRTSSWYTFVRNNQVGLLQALSNRIHFNSCALHDWVVACQSYALNPAALITNAYTLRCDEYVRAWACASLEVSNNLTIINRTSANIWTSLCKAGCEMYSRYSDINIQPLVIVVIPLSRNANIKWVNTHQRYYNSTNRDHLSK